jgi:hypothetical protein
MIIVVINNDKVQAMASFAVAGPFPVPLVIKLPGNHPSSAHHCYGFPPKRGHAHRHPVCRCSINIGNGTVIFQKELC